MICRTQTSLLITPNQASGVYVWLEDYGFLIGCYFFFIKKTV